MGPKNHVSHGDADPSTGMGNFWRMSGPLKSIGSLHYGVRSERDHSYLNRPNGTTCDGTFG